MDDNGTILDREPVLFMTAIQAVVILAVTFGLKLTPEQTGAILVASAAILGLIARRKVSPTV